MNVKFRTIDGDIEPMEPSELWKILMSRVRDLISEEKEVKKKCLQNKDWVTGQLQHYDIPYEKNTIRREGTNLFENVENVD